MKVAQSHPCDRDTKASCLSPQALSICECIKCGTSAWYECEKSETLMACPACFGHFVLDVENYPTAYMARKNWPTLIKRREAAIKERTTSLTTKAQRHREEAKV